MSDGSSRVSPLTSHVLHAFAVAPPGFEDLVAGELAALGLRGVRQVQGGAEFTGGWSAVYRANLFSRVASRVLVRVAGFAATTFRQLAAGFAAVPWAGWLPAGAAVELRASCRRSRLYHSGRVCQELAAALERALGAGQVRAGEGGLRLQVRLERDRVAVSLDTSGEHLHRRGYRDHAGAAPLRENLAAGLLMRAGWEPGEPLLDPMCGSGTLAVEAARHAAGIPPGGGREFAFQRLPAFDGAAWEALRETAAPRAPLAPVFAADRDPAAVALAARAARRGGVADAVQVAVAALGELDAPAARGLLVANPPYGRRLGGETAAYRDLGRALRGALRGWRWGVVVAGDRARSALGLAAGRSHPFRSGGIALRFELGEAQQP